MNNRPLHLLLADDDQDDCDLFLDALQELSLEVKVSVVRDGEELMQFLNKRGEKFPDLLFMDLNMPRKNGFECLNEIGANNKFTQLPIIIFSTSFNEEIAELLYKNGARHYIRKPNEFEKLKQLIHKVLSAVSSEPVSGITFDQFIIHL